MIETVVLSTRLGFWQIEGNGEAVTKVGIYSEPLAGNTITDSPVLQEACRQITAYCDRELQNFDLPLAPAGPKFHQQVWDLLVKIPFGRTTSYGELAAELGGPTLSRAVGQANAKNPIAVLIPCHRVIGRNGSLTGYAGGLSLKQLLLEHEQGLQQDRLDL